MKLRTLVIICLLVVLAIGGSAYATVNYMKHRYDPVALADIRLEKGKKAGLKCLQSNKTLKLPSQDQRNIGAAAIRHIKDLPASAKATVSVASFESNKSASGSVSYDQNIGAYNFELKVVGEYWRVASYKACDK